MTSRDRPVPREDRARILVTPTRLSERQAAREVRRQRPASTTGQSSSKGLKMAELSVRSLAPALKMDAVRMLLIQHDLDLLCITESWLTTAISDNVLLFPGYQVFRRDRQLPRRNRARVQGGGLVILLREGLNGAVLDIESSPYSPVESLWLSVTSRGRTATVGVLYRAPDGPVSADIEEMRAQLEAAVLRNKPLYLLADTNIDVGSCDKPGVASYPPCSATSTSTS